MDAELEGRLLALEVMAMSALGIYLSNSRNDPDMSKAIAFLNYLRQFIRDRASGLSEDARASADKWGDDLLSQVLENLRQLRG